MSTSTAMASMTMTSASSMASSTSGMDMDSSSMMMSSADMAMVFFQSVTTPLYSSAWTPQGQGSYAGTCIFLIVLALVHRILIAGRAIIFDSNQALSRRRKDISSDSDEYPGSKSDLESMGERFRSQWSGHPFKVATETARALLEVIIGGIGYLLMLAVMTMNVGYFLSVLGGIFLGTFVAGRFGGGDDHH
ncbi:Ctr copper transporter family-domain-containing protein [Annulohypoxylon truncatum]|uniref:Ctr copper transporter family-domain-containing protein n=1 Tax=Annulohypoxylon truncatum TaxID=327061 RepID=UPI0020085E63|nr:Ctr copper transporter family-domain-containing protein [Annulohypoxylon truncatum]KAI1205201.1 Ctr copper transporter family-domain-containing protein [Annulohypoxylon truncatum]